ncbi:MAG TPA: helix-turn-helix domain-containing protein [Bradyrhizobium sp.]|nr:helix-turn-helix domain-containing protein [Bradyrhizobium sp.]
MSPAATELALRAASIALLLLLAAALLRDFRSSMAGRLAIALALGTAAHAATTAIGAPSSISVWHAPLIALSTGNVVVFWLFCRVLFDDSFTLRWRHGLIWLAVAAISFVNCFWLAPAGNARVSVAAINLLALGFILLAVGQVISSWSADLVEGRRHLRIFIVAAAALYGGLNAVLQMLALQGRTAAIADIANMAMLTTLVAAICAAMVQVTARELFPVADKAPAGGLVAKEADTPDQKLIDALMRLMADERIYRHDNVTIGALATRLGIPEYRLRRLINQKLGYRNFNVFLNNHRIEEAKAALADPAQAEVPVITIAMDAGFQSLGPFNRAFKATTGVTPSEYRKLKASAA